MHRVFIGKDSQTGHNFLMVFSSRNEEEGKLEGEERRKSII